MTCPFTGFKFPSQVLHLASYWQVSGNRKLGLALFESEPCHVGKGDLYGDSDLQVSKSPGWAGPVETRAARSSPGGGPALLGAEWPGSEFILLRTLHCQDQWTA